jgi:catechol 2,3-dioxygenase-like lactoylglutathione lyase family enzyme
VEIKRLDHFGIEVRDLPRAEGFYTSVLGFTVVNRFGDQVLLDCGGQNLALFEVQRPPLTQSERRALINRPLGKGHFAFALGATPLAVARDELQSAGAEVARAIDWGDHDCLYFLDPDGNLLELIKYR